MYRQVAILQSFDSSTLEFTEILLHTNLLAIFYTMQTNSLAIQASEISVNYKECSTSIYVHHSASIISNSKDYTR